METRDTNRQLNSWQVTIEGAGAEPVPSIIIYREFVDGR